MSLEYAKMLTLMFPYFSVLLTSPTVVQVDASSASCFDFMCVSWSKCATSRTRILCHVIVDLLN